MASSTSLTTVNWERLVRAALKRGRAGLGLDSSAEHSVVRTTMIERILQAVSDIENDDPDVARIICEQAYAMAQNLDPMTSDGSGPLKLRTGLACVVVQKLAKKYGGEIDRQNDTQVLWNFSMEYMNWLRANFSTDQMGASDMQMEKSYATLRALLDALKIVLGKSPIDKLGRLIPDEVRRIEGSDAGSTTVIYRLSPAVNWERLVHAALRPGAAGLALDSSVEYSFQKATIIERILRVVDIIDSNDPNVARILCEQAYMIAQNLDPSSDGVGALKFRAGLASLIAHKKATRHNAAIYQRNDTQTLWNFYMEYMSWLRADGIDLEPGRLKESATCSTEMGASDMEMEKVYATLRALLDALKILVEKSPIDTLGREILDEIRRIKEPDACSTTAKYSVQYSFRKTDIIDQILQAVDDIDIEDPDIARILCEHAYSIAVNLDSSCSDGRGALKLRTGVACVLAQNRAKRDEAKRRVPKIDRKNDTQILWNYYMGYMNKLRADGMHVEAGRLKKSAAVSTECGSVFCAMRRIGDSDRKMKKSYATLRALLDALEIVVEMSPSDTLGRQILHEIRRIKESHECSTAT